MKNLNLNESKWIQYNNSLLLFLGLTKFKQLDREFVNLLDSDNWLEYRKAHFTKFAKLGVARRVLIFRHSWFVTFQRHLVVTNLLIYFKNIETSQTNCDQIAELACYLIRISFIVSFTNFRSRLFFIKPFKYLRLY